MARGGGGGVLPPAPATNWSAAYGGVPQAPSPGVSATQAIASNLGNLSSLYGLAGGVNTFNQNQINQNYASTFPGFQQGLDQSSRNIQSKLKGDVPQDVIRNLLQGAAERGIVTGTYGSDNSNAAYLRALGLTSLDMMNQGEQQFTQAINRVAKAPLFDVNPYMVTADQQQQAQIAANVWASAPNPRAAAQAGLGAALAGTSAGARAGAVNTPAIAPYQRNPASFGLPGGGNIQDAQYGMTQAYGGDPSHFVDPNAAATNWSQWAQGIYGGAGGGGNYYSGGYDQGPSALAPEAPFQGPYPDDWSSDYWDTVLGGE